MTKVVRKQRTVYNNDNMGHKDPKGYFLFMDPPLGLHDSINVRYPILMELYKLQRSLIWVEDENQKDLAISRMDMLSPTTKREYVDILDLVVSYLWEVDSIASRSVITMLSPYISNSELTTLLTEHTRFENIHALTYSEIVRQCFDDQNVIIDRIAKNNEILDRTTLIIEAFDDLVKYGSIYSLGDQLPEELRVSDEVHREAILKGLMALLLLERVQFMSSFAVVFGLAELDIFKGISDLVELICRDELLHATIISTVINLTREKEEWDKSFNKLKPVFMEMIDEVVKREFRWNEYLFSEGRTMVGLNEELLNDWVLYNLQDMCQQVGLPYEYKEVKENPIPWVDSHIQFDKVQNANQESTNTRYRMNAITDDLGDEVFEI